MSGLRNGSFRNDYGVPWPSRKMFLELSILPSGSAENAHCFEANTTSAKHCVSSDKHFQAEVMLQAKPISFRF